MGKAWPMTKGPVSMKSSGMETRNHLAMAFTLAYVRPGPVHLVSPTLCSKYQNLLTCSSPQGGSYSHSHNLRLQRAKFERIRGENSSQENAASARATPKYGVRVCMTLAGGIGTALTQLVSPDLSRKETHNDILCEMSKCHSHSLVPQGGKVTSRKSIPENLKV